LKGVRAGEGRPGGGDSSRRAGEAYRFSPFFDRTRYPARGFAGGGPGAPGEYYLDDGGGPPRPGEARPNPKQTGWVGPETEIVMGLPGGGGFGDPLARDPQRVGADVRDGYVTPARAREDYGVVVGDGGEVDLPATAALRAARGQSGK